MGHFCLMMITSHSRKEKYYEPCITFFGNFCCNWGRFVILTSEPAEAVKKYSIADLSGSYFYVIWKYERKRSEALPLWTVVVALEGSPLTALEGYQYRDAKMLRDRNGYRRCWYLHIPVSPEGSVLLTEDGYTDPTHCQIVNKGGHILCDSVYRNLGIYSTIGIGVKE